MKNHFRGLGSSFVRGAVYSFVADKSNSGDTFIVQKSDDGRSFVVIDSEARISSVNLPLDIIESVSNFHVSEHDGYYYLTYKADRNHKTKLILAQSTDLATWEKMTVVSEQESSHGKIVSNYTYKDHLMMYGGGDNLKLHATSNLIDWYVEDADILNDRHGRGTEVTVMDAKEVPEGLFVTYYVSKSKKNSENSKCELYASLFDKKNPAKEIWHSDGPIADTLNEDGDLEAPFGLVVLDDAFISYWHKIGGGLVLFYHPYKTSALEETKAGKKKKWKREEIPALERVESNPIMKPRTENSWESKAAFNPAAIYLDGKFHILYRAIGENNVSVLGYAQSDNGVNITYRGKHPAYVPREIFDGALKPLTTVDHENWSPYMSGGGAWGGCEDPRLSRVDNRIYLTYVAYNGWQPPRLAMSWITIEDFLARKWSWSKALLISPPGIVSKSGSILPEKIDGHYVMFHRVFPDIHIDFIDDLDRFDGKSFFLKCRNSIKVREDEWDAGKFSLGATPMKTKDGWLVIYSAVSGRLEWEGSDLRYKIGAMLLDLDDPTKVRYRCPEAVLEPEAHYEREGMKPGGIIYPCGAVIKDEKLFVYYGGSDEYTCVATANLDEFLEKLKNTGEIDESISA